jgi:hypothetical protein
MQKVEIHYIRGVIPVMAKKKDKGKDKKKKK